MIHLKRLAAGAAARLGVLAGVTDLYLLLKAGARGARGTEGGTPSGETPLPPPILRLSSAGTTDVEWFLRSGAAAHRLVAEFRAEGEVLDFGCGCGRVLRHVPRGDRDRHLGIDWNRRAIRWCRRNLAPARFVSSTLSPPLPRDGGQRFALIYSFSVFTHLPATLQARWLRALSDRLAPAGVLLLSTHGRSYLPQLTGTERASFERGEVVVRQALVAGTNVCAAYHPESALRGLLPEDLEIAEHRPEGAVGNPTQDLWVLRRRPAARTTPATP